MPNTIIVGGDDTKYVAYMRLSDPKQFTLGNQQTEIYLNNNGAIQTSGKGKATIAGHLYGNGGTIYAFSDMSSDEEGKGEDDSESSTYTIDYPSDIKYANNSSNVFNMQLWNDSIEGTSFNLDLAHGSTTLFSIEDDPATYHSNEGVLHVSSGTITLHVAELANNSTSFEIANGTLWLEDAVEVVVDDEKVDSGGTNSTQVIISSGGILKHSYQKLADFIGLTGTLESEESTIVEGMLGAEQNPNYVTSQLVFNGGTLWFTDEDEFDLVGNFNAVAHTGTNTKSPIIINENVNGDESNDTIFSNIYVKNAWLKSSLNADYDENTGIDIGNLHLITNNLALSRTNDDDHIITLGDTTISVVEQITNKHDNELLIRTHEGSDEKAVFNLDNEALSNLDSSSDTPLDNLKVDIEDLSLGYGVEFNVRAGNWSANNLTLQSGATLNVGNSEVVRGAILDQSESKLTLDNGNNVVTVYSDGKLKVGALDLSNEDASTINVYGTLEVTGSNEDLLESAQDWYYETSDNDAINVSGANAELIFDSQVLTNISFDESNNVLFSNDDPTFNKIISLTDGATLTLDFADGTSFNIAQVQSLVDTILATHDNHDDSIIDLGSASISALTEAIGDNGQISYDELMALHEQYHVLEHLKVASLTAATVVGITSENLVDGHAGALELKEGYDTALVGGGSLSHAIDGKFVMIAGSNEVGSLHIESGSRFRLNEGGAVNNVSLDEGATLIINSNEGTTKVNDIEGAKATAIFNSGKSEVAQDVEVASLYSTAGSTTVVAGDVTAKNAWLAGDMSVAGAVYFGNGSKEHSYVYNDATLSASAVELTTGSVLAVGMGRETAQHYLVDPTASGSTGSLVTDSLVLNGGTLIADPDYGEQASIVIAKSLSTSAAGTKNYADGNLVAAQNSIIMLGDDASLEKAQSLFDKYLDDETGSLDEATVGSLVYIGSNLTLGSGYRIILDPEEESYEIIGDQGSQNGILFASASTNGRYAEESKNFNNGASTLADIYLGDHTILAIGANVSGTAITLEKTGGTIMAAGDNAKIVVYGSNATKHKVVLFKDGDGDGIHVLGHHDIRVESANGLYFTNLTAQQDTSTDPIELGLDPNKDIGEVFEKASQPGRDYITILLDDGKDGDNEYLASVITDTNGKEFEDAGRIHAFGGTIHATLNALAATTEAVQGHLGEFVTNDQQYGSRLWVHGIKRKSDTQDLSAQGISYGTDLTLDGAAIGIDNRDYANTLLGFALNIGKGEVEGTGSAYASSDEFDYYAASAYAAYKSGNFDIFGDLSYVHTNNKVETANMVSKLTADIDSQVLSVGFQSGYRFSLYEEPQSKYALRPYAALRYSQIKLDDARINSSDYGVVGHAHADNFNLLTLPLGTQFIYEELDKKWKTKLVFDLGAKINLLDDELKTSTLFTNLEDMAYNAATEVVSDVVYGAKLNVTTVSDNWVIYGNVGYSRSSDGSFDELNLNGVVSYRF